jgi:mono/diheme cytochrome c family protein
MANAQRATGQLAARDMQLSSNLLSLPKLGLSVLLLGAVGLLVGTAARAQNIDQGKSATRLYADSCVTCHRNPRGLAKGRFRPQLFLFLQDHYTTSMGAAWELSAYLASVDVPQKGSRPKHAPSTRTPRPSAAVPSARSN